MAKTYTIRLDRWRRLRLTEYACKRLRNIYGGRSYTTALAALNEEPPLKRIAGYMWLFCVSDDPDLTPAVMEGIVLGFLGSGWRALRAHRLNRFHRVIRRVMANAVEGVTIGLRVNLAMLQDTWGWLNRTVGNIAEWLSKQSRTSSEFTEGMNDFLQGFSEAAKRRGQIFSDMADKNLEAAADTVAGFDVLLDVLKTLSKSFDEVGTISKKTFKSMASASKVTAEEMSANLTKLVGALEAAAALEVIDIPIEFNFFPADEPLDTSFYQDFLDMGAEFSAEASRKIKEKAIDPLAKAFDGLYNDIATGLGDAFEGMLDGTKSFGDAFVAIWDSIKKAFFRVIGEMVAKFMVGFIQKIIKGMSLIKAFASALNVGGSLLGAGVAGVAGIGAAGAAGLGSAAAGGAIVTESGFLMAAPAAAGSAIIASWAIPVAFAAVWLGAVFGRLFGKTAADKWEAEFNARMKKKYGQDWTNPPRVITLEQLKQVNPPPPPIDYPGRKKPGGGTVTHPGISGDINITLHVSTLDSENVVNVVRNKVIPVLREAARRHEFWIPLGSAGGV